jgi:integrase
MLFSFARVGANTLRVGDYFENEKRQWLRLHEKGGKRHEVPCHHSLVRSLDDWITAAGIGSDKKGWLFRSIRKADRLTNNRMKHQRCAADDQAANPRSWPALLHLLPHVSRDRHHHLS